jgi:uncharacterized membrane protein
MSKRSLIVISAAVVLAMIVSAGWAGHMLPAGATLPVRWRVDGSPAGFAAKWAALLLPLAVTACVTFLFAAIDRIEPHREAVAHSRALIRAIWLGMIGLMGVVHLMVLDAALSWHLVGPRLLVAAVGLLFVAMGNQLGKSRRMYLVGIRTPWTLANEDVWIATHRLGGKLFVAAGLLWLAVAALGVTGSATLALQLGILALAILAPIAWSYVLWRRAGHQVRH